MRRCCVTSGDSSIAIIGTAIVNMTVAVADTAASLSAYGTTTTTASDRANTATPRVRSRVPLQPVCDSESLAAQRARVGIIIGVGLLVDVQAFDARELARAVREMAAIGPFGAVGAHVPRERRRGTEPAPASLARARERSRARVRAHVRVQVRALHKPL